MVIRKKFFRSEEEAILAAMAFLILVGALNVFSSSYVLATTDFDTPYYFILRHVLWLVLGIIVCVFFARLNYHRLQSPIASWGGIVLVALLLVLVLGVGTVVNGARRWISFGGFSMQPSEFAKLAAIIFFAKAISLRMKAKKPMKVLTHPAFWVIFGLAVLVELEPDMGTALLVLGVPVLMALIVGIRTWEIVAGALLGVAGFIGMILMQPYRFDRIKVVWDPWSDAQGVGYQTVQSMSTIGSGGFLGMGSSGGVSKYAYLPEAHTDFAFAIYAQEHGFVGVILVALLFIFLLICCARVSGRARDEFGQVLALGIMLLVMVQAAANLLMVSGMLPVVGVPLPFISYGGSSLIVTMAAMGILLNISHHSPSYEERRAMMEREMAAERLRIEERRRSLHRVK